MDKTKDVRCGARRQINKQSGHKLVAGIHGIGEAFLSSEKSKKLRRLSSVDGATSPSNEDCKMGSCDSTDRDTECPSHSQSTVSTKRFKVQKKFFDDLNAVNHAPVPRKLRSAMKKRNHKSISPPLPDSKKWNHTLGGVESCGVKKPKLNSKQGIPDRSQQSTVSGPITKDEEEVVQTLFALAGMFQDDDKDGACLDANASIPIEVLESPANTIEDHAEGMNSSSRPQHAGDVPPPSAENSTNESAKVISCDKTASPEQTDFLESQLKHMGPDGSVPSMSLNHNTPSFTKSVHNDEKPCSPVTTCILPEFNFESGFKQSEQPVTPFERVSGFSQEVTVMESQLVVRHAIKEPGKNGLTLWPGLSSTATVAAGSQSPSWSAVAKMPAWVDTAMSASWPISSENCSSKMVSEVTIAKKAMKRSIAHVYIGHLIWALKKQEGKENWFLQSSQLNQHEELKGGVPSSLNSSNTMKNGINITMAPSKSGNFSASGNRCEAKNSIFPQHHKLHQDQHHFPPTSQMHSSKQRFDLLSLSTGVRSLDAKTSGKGSASSTHIQIPYVQSLPEQSMMPFSIPRAHYLPSTYVNRISATTSQVQAQLPQHLNSALHTSHSGISKQEQRLWAVQLSAPYRAVRTSPALSQFPNWQPVKQESPAVMSNASTIFPASSLDLIFPQYSTVPQLLRPLMAGSSLPAERLKIQEHLGPLYEQSGSGFRPQAALPLQLLCNEHL